VHVPRIAFLFACAVSLTLTLSAQSTNGTINGRVLDPSNKVIGGADILVINDATGMKYSGKTNDDGIYVLPNLPPGPYRLQVSKLGFKTIIKPDVVLNIQDALSINFTLPIGAAFEIVTVEGGASMINTNDASVSTVVDQTYVKNMPLNGRSFQDLILLTPGTVTQTPQLISSNAGFQGLGQTGEFSVNGQRMESNYYTVDGVSANVGASAGTNMTQGAGASGSLPVATALGTTQALISVDALQEFRVQASSYSAEYGRTPGGQFAFETKSGTNQWHGTMYEYLRNNYFDANDWFNDYFGVQGAGIRQNDFGGTFGGPVRIPTSYNGKDKTFFFISYEGLRLTSPQPAFITYVPDVALRSTAPAALQPVLDAFPVPNGPDDTSNGIAQFVASWSNPSSLDSTSIRFDHVVNDKLRLFFRFSDTGSNSASRGIGSLTPAVNKISNYTSRTYTAGASNVWNGLTNDFRLNYSSNGITSSDVTNGFGRGMALNLQQLLGSRSGLVYVSYGGYTIELLDNRSTGAQRQWNLVDTVSRSLGRHQLKFGADYRRLAPFAVQSTPSGTVVDYLFFDEPSIQSNSPFTSSQNNAPAHPLYTNFSAFAQDQWRLSSHLSLSLGLRWEVNPAPGVTQGLKPYTVQGSSPNAWVLAPQGTSLWNTAWYNFAPRLGVVYLLDNKPGWETVVRVGGGVFFDTGQQQGSFGFLGPGFVAYGNFLPGGSFPILPQFPTLMNPPVAPYSSVPYVFPSHLQLPYTLQWNASIEQALGKAQVLTLSYVGSHAARLLTWNSVFTPANPNSSSFLFTESGLTSDYNALQIQFRRRLSDGLTGLASYTWSHCLDYGSQNYFLMSQRGDCDFDVRHNLSAALSYDLPGLGQNAFFRDILHHWGVDDRLTLRTGFPVTITGPQVIEPGTSHYYYAGLDLNPGQSMYIYGSQCAALYNNGRSCPGGRAINPNAFSQQPGCTEFSCPPGTLTGSAPRNFIRGFGAWQMDLAVRRDFPIHEGLKLQFRAEAFNVFNHPNFGNIDPMFGSPTFGQATGTLANSLGVVSPLYQMGGPRSMQFALKLLF
jgi:hypothetical protein